MTELLAIPSWKTEPTTLDTWVARLGELAGSPATLERVPPDGAWIVVGAKRVRGFAMLAGPHVEAINFELVDHDPAPATRYLEEVAASLDWELHPDDDEDGDDKDDD